MTQPDARAPIDTGTVTDRRTLRFESIAEALSDAQRIAAAARSGTLRSTGNWTAGQCLGHIAAWIDFSFDGYPFTAPAELAARARAAKDRALTTGLLAGFKIPGLEGGTVATRDMPIDEAIDWLSRAWSRLDHATPTHAHPFFGPLTRDEWLKLQLRHSELHQAYLHP